MSDLSANSPTSQEAPASVRRELAEPLEGGAPVPLWLLVVFFVIVAWGGFYLAFNSGGFLPNVYDANKVAWDGSGSGGAAAAPDPMVIGKRVFNQTCVVCHQANGEGVAGQFPPLVGSEWVLAQSWHGDNHIVRIVLQGLQGPVTVKGQQYNNAMTPWGKTLSDQQVAAVLTYVRNEWGNKAPPISPEFVAKVREETKDRTDPWTQKELQGINRELVEEAAAAPAPEAPAGGAPAPQVSPATTAPGA